MAEAAGESALLEAHGISRALGVVPQTVLQPSSMRVRAGEFVALTGASGSGKSTLLYLLGLLDRPSSGQLRLSGVDTSRLSDDERSRIRRERLGFVFQAHFLLPEFSVLENVSIPMLRRGVPRRAAYRQASETLARLDLDTLQGRKPRELSGGQQQRVSIARAIAGTPELLLADEPTGNLDSKNAETVMELFDGFNRRDGMTIVMVTHDAGFAARATRRIVLKDGAIVSDSRSGREHAE